MKHYLYLFISILFLSSSSFANVNNDLVVFCNDGERFTLILNGQRYNETPATTVKATSLNLKTYQVRIIFENKKKKDLNTNVYFYKTNKECVFGLNNKGKNKYTMDYVSDKDIIEVPVEEKPVTSNNTYQTNSTPVYTPTTTSPTKENNSLAVSTPLGKIGVNENGGVSLGGNLGNVNLNKNDKSGNLSIGKGTDAIVLHKVAKAGCSSPMTPLDFEALQKKIAKQTTDTTNLETAKALLDGSCLKTSQVKEVMQTLKHDETKLDYAKHAYSHTSDLNNYYQLKSELVADSKKEELQKFIKDSK
jgi:hypothetical protein